MVYDEDNQPHGEYAAGAQLLCARDGQSDSLYSSAVHCRWVRMGLCWLPWWQSGGTIASVPHVNNEDGSCSF